MAWVWRVRRLVESRVMHRLLEKLKKKKSMSPGCWMATQMVVDVGRNAECLFDCVASLWAAYAHSPWVDAHSSLCMPLLWAE